MYFKHICFGVVLISILSHGDATETSKHLVITSEITGAKSLQLEPNESGRDKEGQHEFDDILKYKKYDNVHLVCENTKYSQSDTLQWKIVYNRQTTCLKQHRNKIHYINRLDGTQNKAILKCEDGNKHFTAVKMDCTNCYGETTGKTLLLNCPSLNKTTPIATYINGESKTLQERRHQYKLGAAAYTTATVYCQTENGVFWDWQQSTVRQEATKTISSSDNLVGLTVNLTEAMDGTTLICTDKETEESVKIIFELTSSFFITINNNTRSYHNVRELQYRTNDSFLLDCKVDIPAHMKGMVGVEWLKNEDSNQQCARDVNYNSLNKLENLTCHLTELTEADNNAKIICQLSHIQIGPHEKRAIVLKYMDYQEGTTESEDLIDDSYKDMQTDGHGKGIDP